MKAILLVEGEGDRLFFEALLRRLDMNARVVVKPPRSLGKSTDTVSHFPDLIDTLVGKRMATGELEQLGIVADADHTSGGGVETRWKTITNNLKEYGYRIPNNMPKSSYLGTVFNNAQDLPPVGLWLMPDHQRNGMLEDLIKAAVDQKAETTLLEYAEKVVRALPERRFSDLHQTKALIYTWLAWQKRPGQTLDVVINGNLIDWNAKPMKGLVTWLTKVFPKD